MRVAPTYNLASPLPPYPEDRTVPRARAGPSFGLSPLLHADRRVSGPGGPAPVRARRVGHSLRRHQNRPRPALPCPECRRRPQ